MGNNKNLFPVFEMPDAPSPLPAEEQNYKCSLFFDYELGDFRRDGANRMVTADGQEAFCQWCIKVVYTERNTRLAYSSDIGVEIRAAVKLSNPAAVESAIERTITEALMVNPRTEYVRDFSFSWEGDNLWCSFTVKGREWEEIPIKVRYAA